MNKKSWFRGSLVLLLNVFVLWPPYFLACGVLWLIGAWLIPRKARAGLHDDFPSKVWPNRWIERFTDEWMNVVWGNEQEGVNGIPYTSPSSVSWWKDKEFDNVAERIIAWSVYRNSTNNLRFMHYFIPWLGWINPKTIKPGRVKYCGSSLTPVLSVLEQWKINDPGAASTHYIRRFAFQFVWQDLYGGLRIAFRWKDGGHQVWFGWKLNPGMSIPGWWPEDPCWKGVGFTCGQVRHTP